ncbi:MAG TPA: hypothetical protein VGP26_31505 [Actinophytocola sp.]|nr:hypothetical protein [Actinophytocola sp.]
MNVHKRPTPEEAVDRAWLEKVAGEMLADASWQATRQPAPPAVTHIVDEDQPASDRRPARPRKAKVARDGYGRPLRPVPVPPPATECQVRQEMPRTGHPPGIAGKVLLGAALTGVGWG